MGPSSSAVCVMIDAILDWDGVLSGSKKSSVTFSNKFWVSVFSFASCIDAYDMCITSVRSRDWWGMGGIDGGCRQRMRKTDFGDERRGWTPGKDGPWLISRGCLYPSCSIYPGEN